MMANKLTAAPKNCELSNYLINVLYLDWQIEYDIHDTTTSENYWIAIYMIK